jgi:hypothetical protein
LPEGKQAVVRTHARMSSARARLDTKCSMNEA